MNRTELWAMLGMALVGGAAFAAIAKHDAAILGLTAVELSLLTAAAGAIVSRKIAS